MCCSDVAPHRADRPSPTPDPRCPLRRRGERALAHGADDGPGDRRSFASDEGGAIIMFVLVLFLIIAVIAGMAIDLARHETARADLQNALDRGVLAAANYANTVPDKAAATRVIQDYMISRQQRNTAVNIDVTNTPIEGGREVRAEADLGLDTIFLNAMGLDSLKVPAVSGAAEAFGITEVVLVLDVSGSMDGDSSFQTGQTKLDDLKTAAKQFVDVVFTGSTGDQMLISVVPYSAQVALPDDLAALFTIDRHHTFSNCIDYASLDYGQLALSRTAALDQHEHYITRTEDYEVVITTTELQEVVTEVERTETYMKEERVLVGYWRFFGFLIPIYQTIEVPATRTVIDTVTTFEEVEVTRVETRTRAIHGCPGTNNAVLAYSNDPTELKDKIDALTPQNWTASSVGMKWAGTLLDPIMRDYVTAKVDATTLSAEFAGWPRGWNTSNGRKVVILMTDGVNTVQQRPRSGNYIYPGLDAEGNAINYGGQSGLLPADFADLDAYLAEQDLDWNQRDRRLSTILDDRYDIQDGQTYGVADADLLSMCDQIKAQSATLIYTIGFEVDLDTDEGKHVDEVLRDCASRVTNHYMVSDIDIVSAFGNIGAELRKLKLVN